MQSSDIFHKQQTVRQRVTTNDDKDFKQTQMTDAVLQSRFHFVYFLLSVPIISVLCLISCLW